MKKTLLLLVITISALFTACKKETITNVYTNGQNTTFIVGGIHDITFQNTYYTGNTIYNEQYLSFDVQYEDSVQETVALSLSGLPAGITMDTSAVLTGIAPYSTSIYLYDTTAAQAVPGIYTVTLTATGNLTGAHNYTFKIKVVAAPSLTANIVGKYSNSNQSCTGATFADSVYSDSTNKIYFTNFLSTGQKIYAYASPYGSTSNEVYITIPQQTVGGYTFYEAYGYGYYQNGAANASIYINSVEYSLSGNMYFCSETLNR